MRQGQAAINPRLRVPPLEQPAQKQRRYAQHARAARRDKLQEHNRAQQVAEVRHHNERSKAPQEADGSGVRLQRVRGARDNGGGEGPSTGPTARHVSMSSAESCRQPTPSTSATADHER